jgi:aspartate/methionine/tyrosine aminotransferase
MSVSTDSPALYTPAADLAAMMAASLRGEATSYPADCVDISKGEPDFDTPAPIIDAMTDALRSGYTHYTSLVGDPELRAKIAAKYAHCPTPPDAADVLVTHGGAAAIMSTMSAVLNPGDTVVIPEPTFSVYADTARFRQAKVEFVPLTADLHLDLDALRTVLPGARLLVLCNPGNPTGAVCSRADLEAVADMLAGTDTLLLADEAYENFVFEGEFTSALDVPGLAERTMLVQTFSKSYAMTGWRLGYAITPPGVTQVVQRMHRLMNGSVSTAGQRAAIAALDLGEAGYADMVATFRHRRDYVSERLDDMPGVTHVKPQGAFYTLFAYPQDLPSTTMLARLGERGVALRAGAEYGPSGEGHLRLSFAADMATLVRAMDIIELGIKEIEG